MELKDYIIVVDYCSKLFEMERLYSCTAAAVITKLKSAMVFLKPSSAAMDHATVHMSFSALQRHGVFTHTTTSPHYPQSNGIGEKTVQTAKCMLDKAKAENKDPYHSLLEYCNTPVDNLKSPTQLLMSRRLRLILPATAEQLQPQVTCQQSACERREACQHHQDLLQQICQTSTPPSCGYSHLFPAGRWLLETCDSDPICRLGQELPHHNQRRSDISAKPASPQRQTLPRQQRGCEYIRRPTVRVQHQQHAGLSA